MANAVEKAKQAAQAKPPALSIRSLITKSAKELGKALPAHMNPERMTRIALTTLNMNPKLYKANPYSFLAALFQCAQLGLEPNIEGQAYIIPYNIRDKGLMAQFQIGYKGYIDLFWRHQNAVSIQMEKVHEADHFEYDLGANTVHHRPPRFIEERGPVIGYYAVAQVTGGGRMLKVMSRQEAFAWGKRYSKCWDRQANDFKPGTPWKDHFDAMGMKTVAKQLSKLLPKSIELQHAMAMDETVKTRIEADMIEVPPEDIGQEEEPAPAAGEPAGEATESTESPPPPANPVDNPFKKDPPGKGE